MKFGKLYMLPDKSPYPSFKNSSFVFYYQRRTLIWLIIKIIIFLDHSAFETSTAKLNGIGEVTGIKICQVLGTMQLTTLQEWFLPNYNKGACTVAGMKFGMLKNWILPVCRIRFEKILKWNLQIYRNEVCEVTRMEHAKL